MLALTGSLGNDFLSFTRDGQEEHLSNVRHRSKLGRREEFLPLESIKDVLSHVAFARVEERLQIRMNEIQRMTQKIERG
jgi:hypothetical protein